MPQCAETAEDFAGQAGCGGGSMLAGRGYENDVCEVSEAGEGGEGFHWCGGGEAGELEGAEVG